jgi:hypothetical protein
LDGWWLGGWCGPCCRFTLAHALAALAAPCAQAAAPVPTCASVLRTTTDETDLLQGSGRAASTRTNGAWAR